LKQSNNPSYITFLDQRDNEKNGAMNYNDDMRIDTPLSEKVSGQHSDNTEKIVPVEDKFDSLMQTSRHLAHEFNNLLTTILANTQLALLMVEDDKVRSHLDTVEEAAGEIAVMVRKFQGSLHTLDQSSRQEDS